VLLLGAGVLDLLAGTTDAVHAVVAAREAAVRLAALTTRCEVATAGGSAQPGPPAGALPIEVVRLRLPGQAAGCSPVSFRVPAAGILVVTGRSGRGKTTLLRTISGDVGAVGGTVRAGGAPPGQLSPGRLVFVEHDDHVFAGTVADNLHLADPDLSEPDMRRLLGLMRLSADGITPSTRVGDGGRTLSGGEQRRLALARAAAARPDVLLLDEPVEGVDPVTARAVLADLRQLLPWTTLVVAVHDRHLRDLPHGFEKTLSLDDGVLWRETPAARTFDAVEVVP
jgi:ABC-type transport system involved in cytochrome bd biosynthesis fused ATPase/permease subunit